MVQAALSRLWAVVEIDHTAAGRIMSGEFESIYQGKHSQEQVKEETYSCTVRLYLLSSRLCDYFYNGGVECCYI